MERQKCENCRFFSQLLDDDIEKGKGDCLRYPPQAIWFNVDEEKEYDPMNRVYWTFPHVSQSFKCGEWRPILKYGKISAYHEE